MSNHLTSPPPPYLPFQIALFRAEGVELVFSEDAVKEIAHIACEINSNVANIGARRLFTVVERVLQVWMAHKSKFLS